MGRQKAVPFFYNDKIITLNLGSLSVYEKVLLTL